jgi:tol-pal system protein YbgF
MKPSVRNPHARLNRWLVAVSLGLGCVASHAGIFDDDEARKAILDLRQRNDSLRQSQDEANKRLSDEVKRIAEDNVQLRRSLLDFQNQFELLKQDQAKLRGQSEQTVQDVAEVQRRQKDLAGGLDERLRKVEPVKVTVDGRDFTVEPTEKKDYDAALAVFRKGEFAASQTAFFDLIKRYPQSGYIPSALFWLANAQYATREYKEAVINFKSLVAQFPDHVRSPEAMLSIANCQAELKDTRAARKTLDELLKNYPHSEAAVAGKERLARLK